MSSIHITHHIHHTLYHHHHHHLHNKHHHFNNYFATGYYCTSGVDRPNPSVGNETYNYTTACPPQTLYTGIGGLCPVGFYCPTGTTSPLACPAGTYADHQGMDACITCPQGYYCQVNSSNYQDTPCQPGEITINIGKLYKC